MSTLQDIRDKVRTQTDLDDEDLVDLTLDGFIEEAFDRTFAREQRWPFFEYTWTLTKALDETTITMPTSPSVAFVQRLRSDAGVNLTHLGTQLAEETFQGDTSVGTPDFFSMWGGVLSLWPTPTAPEATYTLRGYRKPTWTGVAGSELDGDARLHLPIFHYAAALAYVQLEDSELASTYMQNWAAGVDAIHRNCMRPQSHEPLILSQGARRWRNRSGRVSWGTLP